MGFQEDIDYKWKPLFRKYHNVRNIDLLITMVHTGNFQSIFVHVTADNYF